MTATYLISKDGGHQRRGKCRYETRRAAREAAQRQAEFHGAPFVILQEVETIAPAGFTTNCREMPSATTNQLPEAASPRGVGQDRPGAPCTSSTRPVHHQGEA